jgi:hypothetical protein
MNSLNVRPRPFRWLLLFCTFLSWACGTEQAITLPPPPSPLPVGRFAVTLQRPGADYAFYAGVMEFDTQARTVRLSWNGTARPSAGRDTVTVSLITAHPDSIVFVSDGVRLAFNDELPLRLLGTYTHPEGRGRALATPLP